jgi:glycine/D-amino acid oxidase-like deaminating enzyme
MASSWETKDKAKFSKLNTDTTAEVCIVGGGLAGVWCAFLLAREGVHVVLLEKDRLGGAETMYTTAFLTQYIDTDPTDLIKMYGISTTRKIWESHGKAIDDIERVIKEESIECDFTRTNNYVFASSSDELKDIEKEHEAIKRLGFSSTIRKTPFQGFLNVGGLILGRQGKYHPMKFFSGLVRAASKLGAEFYEHTEVVSISGRAALTIETKNGKVVKARDVVVATYDPFNNPKPVHFKKGMYESYVYELRVKHGLIAEGIYEDDKNPYHYFRVDPGSRFDRIIVGGEDHRSELLKLLEKKSFKALEEWVEETFAGMKYTITKRWHGAILEPSDGLALIGEYAPHQYVVCAFSGNGMTYSAISGRLITDLIFGKKNNYAKIYDPKRKLDKTALLKKARDYTEELVQGAAKNILK